jgi:hypothetical protein
LDRPQVFRRLGCNLQIDTCGMEDLVGDVAAASKRQRLVRRRALERLDALGRTLEQARAGLMSGACIHACERSEREREREREKKERCDNCGTNFVPLACLLPCVPVYII